MPLFRKRLIYVPTIWGTLFLVAIFSFISYLLLIRTYIFLAPEKEPRSKILVVEGWIDEISVGNALKLYQSRDYEYLIITGVPITQWTFSSPFTNMADATAESIKRMYFPDTLYRVIVPSNILRDRTYTSALALKMKLEEWQLPYKDFDLYTVGAHARRSYLVYRKAFHDDRYIGLIADTDSSFDSKEWFGTSRGFRIVIGELISYFYAYLFFHPDENYYKQLIQDGHYADGIRDKRTEKDRLFSDTINSPLNRKDIETFRGLPYFAVNPDYKIRAFLKPDTVSAPFFMHTTTERKPRYRKYGDLQFEFNNTQHSLEAYQNLDMLEKKPEYRGLFVPFKDSTNGEQTYGGGRYLDVQIPLGDSVVIDFNQVYNPYCAYDEKWSCPLVPSVNYLPVAVRAGEKAYKKNK
jgi:uncharacterized protein